MLVGKETVTLAPAMIIAQHLLFLTMLLSSLVKKREELRNLLKIIKEAGDTRSTEHLSAALIPLTGTHAPLFTGEQPAEHHC